MNERIRELAEQAFDKANNGTISDIKIPKEFIEKFAKFIVKECAELATKEYHNRSAIHGNDLLEHFGVEA
jgi:hypothetical protein